MSCGRLFDEVYIFYKLITNLLCVSISSVSEKGTVSLSCLKPNLHSSDHHHKLTVYIFFSVWYSLNVDDWAVVSVSALYGASAAACAGKNRLGM